jgi:murein L,D-transpeptidase YafK
MRLFFKCLLIVLMLSAGSAPVESTQKADSVLVIKSEKRLYLLHKGEQFAALHVTFGAEPVGHKQVEGDGRTPEGHYMLTYKNSKSKFYKSIHISYPNARDRENARRLGVDPGGNIMIHGLAKEWEWAESLALYFSWTNGCIALRNRDMDRVWEAVDPGTPIEIRP